MSEDCIFCGIVAGDIPSNAVYETDDVFAFLDVNPLVRGHTLVIPKDHYERVNDMPPEIAGAVGEAISVVAPAVEAAVDAPASTIAYNNGEEAGQEVPHVHAHVIPQFPDRGGLPIHALFEDAPELSDDEMAAVADDITAAFEN